MSPLHNQFRIALKRGSGRAMLLLRARPSSKRILADLMHACEADLRYDPQCEESRAAWLYRLVRETGQTQKFLDRLSRRLSDANQETDAYDVKQIFEILCIAAKEDKNFDRAVLRDFLLRAVYEPDGINCISSFVELEGIDGLLLCVRRYYENLADDGGWVFQIALETLAARDGKEAATAVLTSARAGCDELDRLLMLSDIKPELRTSYTPSDTNYSILRGEADSGGFFPRAWIEAASVEELVQAADDLLQESDEIKIWRILQIFGIRDFPRPPKTIFPFVRSSNKRIAGAAARALARVNDPEVRALALELLSEGPPHVAVELLQSNFQHGDCRFIEDALEKLSLDEKSWHSLSMAFQGVISRVSAPDEESRRVLIKIYEKDPCSLCRTRTVSALAERGGVPDWIAEECRFDADPDTVALIGEHQVF